MFSLLSKEKGKRKNKRVIDDFIHFIQGRGVDRPTGGERGKAISRERFIRMIIRELSNGQIENYVSGI